MTQCAAELADLLWRLDALTFWVCVYLILITVYSVEISCAFLWVVRRVERQENLYDTGQK